MDYRQLLITVRKQKKLPFWQGTLLAIDPGETTGFAVFSAKDPEFKFAEYGQLDTKAFPAAAYNLRDLIERIQPDRIICEDYRIYAFKSEEQKWSNVFTVRVIGALQALACLRLNPIPVDFELAQQPKNFVTDDKLTAWGYYVKGMRHARDAMRHALYWLMFHNLDDNKKPS